MIFIYLSGKDISVQKVEKLNKIIEAEKFAPDRCKLSFEDKIFIIPNASSITGSSGRDVVCMETRASLDEPTSKVSAIIEIIENNIKLSKGTELIKMSPL
ncbi:MAG: hypothetical protein WC180_00900 [Candidatus Paceibacterota bacterium]